MKKILTFLMSLIMLVTVFCGCNDPTDSWQNPSPPDETEDNNSNNDLTYDNPVIENIGLNIDYYNTTTNKAGDFQFDTFIYPWGEEIYNKKVFYDYGFILTDEDGTNELEPQPIFIAPLGTKVHAITSGVVSVISTLYSDDYTIQVIKDDNPKWIYEHEHVINVSVEVGDKVTAGQIIAEVSDYNTWLKNDGYGVLDIGILSTDDDGGPWHHCPFMYLNESVKQDYFDKISALYTSWEEYAGNYSLYNEDEHEIPGCVICDPINR